MKTKQLLILAAILIALSSCKKEDLIEENYQPKNYDLTSHNHKCYKESLPYEVHQDSATNLWIYCYKTTNFDTIEIDATDRAIQKFIEKNTKPVQLYREIAEDTIKKCNCQDIY